MADSNPILLSTGTKEYSLEIDIANFDYQKFMSNQAQIGYEAFCKHLQNSSPDPPPPLPFLVHGRGCISHQLLKADGFALGEMCNKFGPDADGGSDSSHFAVFEVLPHQAPNAHMCHSRVRAQRCSQDLPDQPVPGEYVVFLFPDLESFRDRHKGRLKLSVMCMYVSTLRSATLQQLAAMHYVAML